MSRTKDPTIDNDDGLTPNPGFVGKTLSGNLNYTVADGVEAADLAGNFVNNSVVQVATMPLSGIHGALTASEDEKRSKKLGIDTKRHGNSSPLLKDSSQELKDRWHQRMRQALVSSAGAMAGAAGALWIGTSFIPGLNALGWAAKAGKVAISIAGMAGGGYAANKAYETAFPTVRQDALSLLTQIKLAQKNGEQIPKDIVFAALVNNFPDRMEKQIVGVNKALSSGNDEAVAMAMEDPKIQKALLSKSMLPVDFSPEALAKADVVTQATDFINKGGDPLRLLLPPSRMSLEYLRNATVSGIDPTLMAIPMTPGKAPNRGQGVAS